MTLRTLDCSLCKNHEFWWKINKSPAISITCGMFNEFILFVFRLSTCSKFDPPPPFLLLFFYVLTSSGHLPFFVPLPQEELKKLKITNNYLRFNFEPINQLSCLAKIYPDITLSSFYLLKLSCKQNYTVDLEIDQNIDICIISYFYTFPTNEGDKVFVTITF